MLALILVFQYVVKLIIPILFSIVLIAYYSQNYASIIGQLSTMGHPKLCSFVESVSFVKRWLSVPIASVQL